MREDKKVVIIAGPNGSGKTTFAREFLPVDAGLLIFVNADLIAAGLSPFEPGAAAIRAGRMMIEEIDRHAAAGHSFAFETTLAGHTYLRRIDAWRDAGFVVKLIFLSLASPEEAIARVAMRVRQGGHDVAPEVIRRRFASGLRNFLEIYRDRVDLGSGSTTAARLLGCSTKDPTHEQRTGIQAPRQRHASRPRALLRAARRAREIARQTNTAIVIIRDGVLVEERVPDIEPDPTSAED